MSDKVLIKQEIKRRIDLYSIAEKDDSTFARMGELSSLMDFIDSLPEESGCEANFTTKNEDFESEWKRYINSKGGGAVTINVKDIARHFAEWQENKDKQSLIDNDTVLLTKDEFEKLKRGIIQSEKDKQRMKETLQTEYEKGRFDMREELIKDAIECIVEDWCGDSPEITIPLNPQDFKAGNKMKIIIIKED